MKQVIQIVQKYRNSQDSLVYRKVQLTTKRPQCPVVVQLTVNNS